MSVDSDLGAERFGQDKHVSNDSRIGAENEKKIRFQLNEAIVVIWNISELIQFDIKFFSNLLRHWKNCQLKNLTEAQTTSRQTEVKPKDINNTTYESHLHNEVK